MCGDTVTNEFIEKLYECGCDDCGLTTGRLSRSAAITIWNAMPRREEFHAELMSLKPRLSVRGGSLLEGADWVKHDEIMELAKQYAPVQLEGKVDE